MQYSPKSWALNQAPALEARLDDAGRICRDLPLASGSSAALREQLSGGAAGMSPNLGKFQHPLA
ncbi:hypothetical protein GCM10007874_11050 [Labrys miyagiensis]|uniref:Uncharacterized protein n=1 Tax=Labrys miyagiensis TaxID=346912 RepID=A0ABQ6CH94_9HYPH|nr:hypothetical protein GCM10007874_11050 [Labrys miyagiensis]